MRRVIPDGTSTGDRGDRAQDLGLHARALVDVDVGDARLRADVDRVVAPLRALAALVLAEALAVRWAFELLLPRASWPAWVPVTGLVLVAAIQAVSSGHAAALHAAQIQFGLLYLGLFGSGVILLYAQAATLVPLGHADALMLAIGAVACVGLLVKRRSRYVDTDAIRPPELPPPRPSARRLPRARFAGWAS